MTQGLAFWIIMLIWTLGMGAAWWTKPPGWPDTMQGFIPWLLFVLIGWKVFGAPLQG